MGRRRLLVGWTLPLLLAALFVIVSLDRPRAAAQSARQLPGATPPSAEPLRFDSEIVRLKVSGDTLHVEGRYTFLCAPAGRPFMVLFYPYPEDRLLGEAHMVSLECAAVDVPHAGWQRVRFAEVATPRGARWHLPMNLGDTLEVRARYRQVLHGNFARYIVTSTEAWREPLKRARFEVYLPPDARIASSTFPFEKQMSDEGPFYLYEATDFLPDRDVMIGWVF